jgi:D-alanyl-D-alanine carboxypeptidase (penicillin-binding protein 5/6)
MVSSGNDAAIALSEAVGDTLKTNGQSAKAAFVEAMNSKAAELGMTQSKFANPHGLDTGSYDEEMYSTAHDVALMCAHAMKNDTFRTIVDLATAQITVNRNGSSKVITLDSTDKLLGVYEGACGIKTGYTEKAGNSFAGAANRGSGDIYAIVLDASDEDARFTDAEALFNWYYNNELTYALAHSSKTTDVTLNGETKTVPVIVEVPQTCWPNKTIDVTLENPEATVEVFAPEGNVSQNISLNEINGGVKAGDVVGTIDFYQGNQIIASQNLVACADSAAPNIFESIGIWWNRLWGNDEPAEATVLNETPLIYRKTALSESEGTLQDIASGTSSQSTSEGASDNASEDTSGNTTSNTSEDTSDNTSTESSTTSAS